MLYENRVENIHISKIKSFSFPRHLHHNVEIMVCTKGSFRVCCNGRVQQLLRGDAMVAFSNDFHEYIETESGKGIMLIFNPDISDLFMNMLGNHKYDNFLLAEDGSVGEELIALVQELYREYHKEASYAVMYGYLHVILGKMIKRLPRIGREKTEQDLLTKVLKYLSVHYTEQLSLTELAKTFGVDPCHLSRVFAQKIPGGYLGYLRELRLEHVKRLLKGTDRSVCEIALESGFTNLRTFNRVFKNREGMTPVEYRRRES